LPYVIVQQGAVPRDLAEQFHKQECMDFLTMAETDAESFEYEESELCDLCPYHVTRVHIM